MRENASHCSQSKSAAVHRQPIFSCCKFFVASVDSNRAGSTTTKRCSPAEKSTAHSRLEIACCPPIAVGPRTYPHQIDLCDKAQNTWMLLSPLGPCWLVSNVSVHAAQYHSSGVRTNNTTYHVRETRFSNGFGRPHYTGPTHYKTASASVAASTTRSCKRSQENETITRENPSCLPA